MTNLAKRPVVNVAAGVLMRGDGCILLAQRPQGTSSAGHWEFPGGKIDAGENEVQAVRREVEEEVGVTVDATVPWLVYTHAYPDKDVRLHIYRITAWHGTPHGKENQRVSWQDPAALTVSPMLPAYGPALRALQLPEVVATVVADSLPRADLLDRADLAMRAGLRVLILREGRMVPTQFLQLARQLTDMARRHGARVHVEAGRAQPGQGAFGGIHLCSCLMPGLVGPPSNGVWSASCRSVEHLEKAARMGADLATVTPAVSPGSERPDWSAVTAMIQRSALPVFVAGDVDLDDLAASHRAGAHGIAVALSRL